MKRLNHVSWCCLILLIFCRIISSVHLFPNSILRPDNEIHWKNSNGKLYYIKENSFDIFHVENNLSQPIRITQSDQPNDVISSQPCDITGDLNGRLFFTECKQNKIKMLIPLAQHQFQVKVLAGEKTTTKESHNYLSHQIDDLLLPWSLAFSTISNQLFFTELGSCKIRSISLHNLTSPQVSTISTLQDCDSSLASNLLANFHFTSHSLLIDPETEEVHYLPRFPTISISHQTRFGYEPDLLAAGDPTSQPSGQPSGQPSSRPSYLASSVDNLVVNPDAETNNMQGWTAVSGSTHSTGFVTSAYSAFGGRYAFITYSTNGWMSQKLNLTIGADYSAGFYVDGYYCVGVYLSIANKTRISVGNPYGGMRRARILFTATIAQDTLTITGKGNGGGGFCYVDEISIIQLRYPSSRPTSQPTSQPSTQPSAQPVLRPTGQPTRQPTGQPTQQPFSLPSAQPTRQPTTQPSSDPTAQPSIQPSSQPFARPSGQPSRQPTSQPTIQPSSQPSSHPSGQPISLPTSQPTRQPSSRPSVQPTSRPSGQPSTQPFGRPSCQPTSQPSQQPNSCPSSKPTNQPTAQPSRQPSSFPTTQPTSQPTSHPSLQPSAQPSSQPTQQPLGRPSSTPSLRPSARPSTLPTAQPINYPTTQPSSQPTTQPSTIPTLLPSACPTENPSTMPSSVPSISPSIAPSSSPSSTPTASPSSIPSVQPSCFPSSQPSINPSSIPSTQPTAIPSHTPSSYPSSVPSSMPSRQPTSSPSTNPSSIPSKGPSNRPSTSPSTCPTEFPSSLPSGQPSSVPSAFPTMIPSQQPTPRPSSTPSLFPSSSPSRIPSSYPSPIPSAAPTLPPTSFPTGQPSVFPSNRPTREPSTSPSTQPSGRPSQQPISRPTGKPSSQPYSRPSSQPSAVPTSSPTLVFYHLTGTIFYNGLPMVDQDQVSQQSAILGSSYVIFGRKALHPFPLEISVVSNPSDGFSAKIPVELAGGVKRDILTRSTTVIGDINGDGYADWLIGKPYTSTASVLFGTSATSGDMSSLFDSGTESFRIIGESATMGCFGWSSIPLNDLNNDGFDDFATSAIELNKVYVFYGKSTFSPTISATSTVMASHGFQIFGKRNEHNFGVAMAFLRDFNRDSYPEIAITSMDISSIMSQNFIYILSLRPQLYQSANMSLDHLPSTAYLKIIAPQQSFAGFSLAGIGDVNDDGFPDLAIGSTPYVDGSFQKVQRAYLIYGKKQTDDIRLYLQNMTRQDGCIINTAGFMVGAIGDVNEDGIPDVMVSNYADWLGKGNTYLIVAPSGYISPPPTLFPTSVPSNQPTTHPSAPFTHAPTLFNESLRSLAPTASPSYRPSFRSTIVPTCSPTELPTRMNFVMSTNSPTIRTRVPTRSTRQPTPKLTRRPTISVTVNTSDLITIEYPDPGTYHGRPQNNNQYLITGQGNYQFTGVTLPNFNVYVIYPIPEQIIIITNFQVSFDILDFTNFINKKIRIDDIEDLSYTTMPLIIFIHYHKADPQMIVLSSIQEMILTEKNFLFPSGTMSNDNNNTDDMIPNVDPPVIVSLGIMIFIVLYCSYLAYQDRLRNEKEEKKILMQNLETSENADHDNRDENDQQIEDHPIPINSPDIERQQSQAAQEVHPDQLHQHQHSSSLISSSNDEHHSISNDSSVCTESNSSSSIEQRDDVDDDDEDEVHDDEDSVWLVSSNSSYESFDSFFHEDFV